MPDPEQSSTSGGEETLATAPAAIVGVEGVEEMNQAAVAALPTDVLADSLSEYFKAWGRRLRNGESGAGPIIVGLIIIIIFFQVEQSVFLHATNLGNLFVQAGVYVMFGVAEMFALLLGEIDLSIGYNAAVGAFVFAELNATPVNWPWWLAVLGALVVTTGVGVLQGALVTRLGLPSFVVTLAGFLGLEGVMLELAAVDKTALGGVIELNSSNPVYKLANANMSPALGWIALIICLVIFAAVSLSKARSRRANGLVAPPLGVIGLTIVAAAIGGIALVAISNVNRGGIVPLKGVPWIVPFVLVVLLFWTFVLNRLRLGRYIYAIGANAEAARRAGINVNRIRTITFAFAGLGAGLAGLTYASRLGSIATDYDGGTIVLYAVAAAVIGGTSLFGGRGKPLDSLLGGLIIAIVINGLGLMGVSAAVQDIVTAIVLLAAVTLDALVRRRASSLTRR